jgi:predicted outer membrane repeat protein
MNTSIQLRKRLISILTLWALTSLACALSDLIPQPCTDTWLITKINVANLDPDTDTIDLEPGCTYEFDKFDNSSVQVWYNALPIVTTPIVIHGNGATLQRSTAAGTPGFRFFTVESGGSLSLDDMTITNGGYAEFTGIDEFPPHPRYAAGGAINNSGTLTIANSIFSNNQSESGGGAIYNAGIANITLSEFTGNQATLIGGVIVNSGELTITGSTFSDNLAERYDSGVILNNGQITITSSAFSNNQAESWGGVIVNRGEMSITGSAFSNNQAKGDGGVIYNHRSNTTLSVSNSAFSGNHSDSAGGAIYSGDGTTLTIETSTIDNNTANTRGAGIANFGLLSITNSTISSNTLMREWEPYPGIDPDYGSAIAHDSSEPLTIRFTTITNNSGISPIQAVSVHGPAEIINSIVADNPGGDCGIFYGGTINASEANLDSDGTCDGFTLTADPRLDPLDDNGGPTQTHALKPNSPAKDAATGACPPPAEDQRGEPRPYPTGGECDLGAYEYSPGGGQPPPAPMVGTQTPTPATGILEPPTVTAITPTNCRSGPASFYDVIGYMDAGDVATAIGTNASYTWTLVELADTLVKCYVYNPSVEINFDPSDLDIVPDPPTPTPTPTITPTLTPTPTPTPDTSGTIGGYVWKDSNSDGFKQGGEAWYPSVSVYLGQGACLSTGYRTGVSAGDGSYSFADLPAGTYCVSVNIPLVCDTYSSATTPTQFTVALAAGQSLNFAFGFATFPC